MIETLFVYGQKVAITSGFYRGRRGICKRCIQSGGITGMLTFPASNSYTIELDIHPHEYIDVPEEHLEAVNE